MTLREGGPAVVLITATDVVPEEALFRRLAALRDLPAELRARFAVMLRDPQLTGRQLVDLGRRLKRALDDVGAALWVNDRLDLALALGAGGVHLGRRSVEIADARACVGSRALVSVACHDLAEVDRAAALGADFAVLSPVFASPGKGPPLGVGALSAARAALGDRHTRLLALGGVDAGNAGACLEAGADGVALVRGDPSAVLVAALGR